MSRRKGAPGPVPADRPERPRKPTLKTIAQISGLAVPTVSRALSDAPDIGAETKKLVRRIADEVGYEPNRAGLGLRTGRTNVVSLILSARCDMMNHTARLITAAAAELRLARYNLIITPYFPDQDPLEAVRYVVESGSADAVILNQILPDDPRVRYLVDKGFPFATHGRTDFGVEHPYYDFDNSAFGRIGIRRLAERGCRSVVMLAPPRGQTYSEHMISAARTEAAKLGLAFQVEDRATIAGTQDEVQDSVIRRLTGAPEIDGYICASTTTTMAAVAAAESLGRTVGEDIEFFAKESASFLKLFRRDIIVVAEDLSRTGTFIAQAVLQAIKHPEKPPMQGLESPEEVPDALAG